MFPLAHIYVAEKKIGKLTDEIKFGSIAPDIISFSPNFVLILNSG